MNNPKLIIDSMLGTIAKKMRILGFDCKYFNTVGDEDLLLVAKKENRTIITKDNKLADNAAKHDIAVVKVSLQTEREQLLEIAKAFGWKKYEYDADRARCPVCNGTLQQIQKKMTIDMVPPRIFEGVERFWICQHCYHLYWIGTHIRNLEKMIGEINGEL
ncbi:MAG TPA: Mut7-C RNAse domain-containing protein [Candidatus Nitrosotenuis sp.]|nr:Mut7-C RNAse domain-containing protein [Candidatus Nitrosotenuis sp.]